MLKVLVAIDGSPYADHAVEEIVRLVRDGLRLQVLLLNVQPEIVEWQTHGIGKEASIAHRRDLGADACTRGLALLEGVGVECEIDMQMGEIAPTIVRVSQERGVGLIAMGTRGMSAIVSLVIGSNATKVLHLSTIPVLLVK